MDGSGDLPPEAKPPKLLDGEDEGPAQPPVPPGGNDDLEDLLADDLDYDEDEDEYGDIDELPDFASKQAQEVHTAIKSTNEVVEKHEGVLTETKESLAVMREHLKNVGMEVGHTSDLVNAKKKEIETEDHLAQLVIRESGRYQQEFHRLEESNESFDDKLNMVQNQIYQGNEKIDDFKVQMNWNQEELEQWTLASKQKEDDNLAMQRYTRADEIRIKEISLQIEKLTQKLIEAKANLENEATETQARQIELDRTAEEFRALHQERQTLVRQWQDTIDAIKRRDDTIQELAVAYGDEKRKHAEQVENLQMQRDHLKGILDENMDVEARTSLLERQVQKQRVDLSDSQQRLQEFTDELEVLKSELASSAAALLKKRQEVGSAAKSLEEKKVLLEDARRKYQQVKKRLEEEVVATQETELSAKDAEQRLAAEEARLKKQQTQVAQLKDVMFRQSQSLFAFRQEEANLIAEISGSQAAGRNLQSKIRSLDQESMRQQELIYNAEFQIQQMERKVARGLGERSDEEKRKLNEQISGLEASLEAVKEQRKMLNTQCRKLNNELRGALRKKEETEAAKVELQARIQELEIETTSQTSTLDRLTREKEEKMVQSDVMKLEVKRLRDALNFKADKVYSLENRKEQLVLSMEERKQEIAVHQDVQRAHLKAAEEEKHKITVELGTRKHAVEKIRDKFETLVKVSAVRAEEDGQQKSQAYYIIQAAQRREEIQRTGDELDEVIRKDEKEIRALSHTLKHLAAKNTNYRIAHQRVEMTGEVTEKMRRLREEAKLAKDALFKRKKELQRLRTDLEEDQQRLEQVEQQAARLEERNTHLSSARQQMQEELEAQRQNITHVDTRIAKFSQAHREKIGVDAETAQEKLFRVADMKDMVQNVLYTLGQLSQEYPEMKSALDEALRDHELTMPNRPASQAARRHPADTPISMNPADDARGSMDPAQFGFGI